MAGSIFLVDGGDRVAKLRLLYVEPWARGMGIGGDLVARCVDFAREAGYATLRLWTHTVLESARRLYAAQGMRIFATAMHDEFGKPWGLIAMNLLSSRASGARILLSGPKLARDQRRDLASGPQAA